MGQRHHGDGEEGAGEGRILMFCWIGMFALLLQKGKSCLEIRPTALAGNSRALRAEKIPATPPER